MAVEFDQGENHWSCTQDLRSLGCGGVRSVPAETADRRSPRFFTWLGIENKRPNNPGLRGFYRQRPPYAAFRSVVLSAPDSVIKPVMTLSRTFFASARLA